jgi:predicted signal transduction protein with EAL and GGDEF domain
MLRQSAIFSINCDAHRRFAPQASAVRSILAQGVVYVTNCDDLGTPMKLKNDIATILAETGLPNRP